MLVNLHVKNFAIIDEIDVDFNKHLNILTGETGAGKSILVGSINIALGGRVSGDMIRKDADYAMVELVFQIENQEVINQLKELDVFLEDGQLVISRKIMPNRSVNKINGESVSVNTIKKVAELCIDIHGQHEHQSLLHRNRHLDIVDEYVKNNIEKPLSELKKTYKKYRALKDEVEGVQVDEAERSRRLSFLEYEKNEIEAAKILENEEDDCEQQYQRLRHAGAIVEALGAAYELTGDSAQGISGNMGRAIKELNSVVDYDENVRELSDQLVEIEGLVSDFNRGVSSYMSDFEFDESAFAELEERLNLIRSIFSRYGGDWYAMNDRLQQIQTELDKYQDYDAYMEAKTAEILELEQVMKQYADNISKQRKIGAKELQEKITEALMDLNFEAAKFEVHQEKKEEITANGQDDIEFLIATNPGEDMKPLGKVASGGELSRIMLAIKSVFAHNDQIETLIFDEIDVGISGRTAQKVSEKMSVLGKEHQIICITHLAQIAAMADTHYVIQKTVREKKTSTEICPLTSEESIEELARILGGAQITEAVVASATEMKELANQLKDYDISEKG